MIIPSVTLSSSHTVEQLVEQVQRWGLFGQIAIREITETSISMMEETLKQVAGFADIHVQLNVQQEWEPKALKLMNAGASCMICADPPQPELAMIPEERLRSVHPDDPDQAVPKHCFVEPENVSVERLSELELARIDALVDVELLEAQPGLIVDFLASVLVSDRPDGLWSTLIVDPLGTALGLAYSNADSLAYAIEHRVGAYFSRSRDDLWIKGETSGATQKLLGVRFDCDRDCLLFRVIQDPPGFCHRNTYTCFGAQRTIQTVLHRLDQRINHEQDSGSFTRKLVEDAELLKAKLLEEAQELAAASEQADRSEVIWETADVLYFSLVAMLKNGVSLDNVYQELARRMNRIVRRKNKFESQSEET